MARTPLLRSLIGMAKSQRTAEARGISLDELHDRSMAIQDRPDFKIRRREFLAGAAASAGLMFADGSPLHAQARRASGRRRPRIAVVGAGIAGLTAALELTDAGLPCTVYEAATRVGGRMYSNSTYFDGGQVFEVYGELLDTPHEVTLGLVRRFGLELDDLFTSHPAGSTEVYHFFGQDYPRSEAQKDFNRFWPVLKNDLDLVGEETSVQTSNAYGRRIDNMSLYDWIETRVPGGHRSPLGMLLDTAYYIELNSDTREQSALNLVYMLGGQPNYENFDMFGESDERYKIRGGNQLLPLAMARHLGPDVVRRGMRMEALAKRAQGDYELVFQSGSTSERVIADFVILTVPFAVLAGLDTRRAGFSARKQRVIRDLGRGRQSKQHLQFNRRIWNEKGPRSTPGNGSSYSDTGYQATWEATRGQAGESGIFVAYCGGPYADAMATPVAFAMAPDPAVRADAMKFLAQAEPVYPGITALWNGKAAQGLPHLDPNYGCSYSYFRRGQYQTIAGIQGDSQGRVYFAGEHTSTEFQGFMEGGATEGKRAAQEVVEAVAKW